MNRKKSKSERLLCTMLTATIVLSVFTAGLGLLPVSADPGQVATVTRNLPDYVGLGETFTVTLTQSKFFLDLGIVWEVLPEGFEYVDGSYEGGAPERVTWDPATRTLMVSFFAETIITYDVIAASGDQTAAFSGTYKTWVLDPVEEWGDVTGDTEVTVDGAGPYTDQHNPAKGATGVPVDTNVVLHVKDNYEVDTSTIEMTVNGNPASPLQIVPADGTVDDWVVTYNPQVNFGHGEVVAVTVDAADKAGNAMPQDAYSFTTQEEGGDTDAPVVTNPTADPQTIPEDTDDNPTCFGTPYSELSQLNVTVTDESAIASVTIDLSSIGGSAVQAMTNTGGDVWAVSTNASAGTDGWTGTAYVPYQLQVNATDEHGLSNTAVSIPLTVMKNGDVNEDGAVSGIDAMFISQYLAGVRPASDLNLPNAEVSGDCTVSGIDAMFISQHVAGFRPILN
ncbi:hypothetical protein C5S30_06505 [ANME-1 cluster archaeon GoMg4]|nr:hypothetical protein [ANME-1 cluster archaeon GoMg4]